MFRVIGENMLDHTGVFIKHIVGFKLEVQKLELDSNRPSTK